MAAREEDAAGRCDTSEPGGRREEELCAVCQGPPQRPLRTQPCGHSLCGRCLVDHLAHSLGRGRCPVCRSPVRRAEVVYPEPGSWYLSVRHGNVLFHLDFRTLNSAGTGVEKPLERLSELFRVPVDRIKLVHRGRVVLGTGGEAQWLGCVGLLSPWVGALGLGGDRMRGQAKAEWRRSQHYLQLLKSSAQPATTNSPFSARDDVGCGEEDLLELSRAGATLMLVASRPAGVMGSSYGSSASLLLPAMAALQSFRWRLCMAVEDFVGSVAWPLLSLFRVFFASVSPSWKPEDEQL